jgi:large subunit ribosomal protein L9
VEVILQEEVPALGREGDVVKVAPGYANNYLIPRGVAVMATRGNLKQLEQKRAGIEKRHAAAQAETQALADKFAGRSVTITARAGEEGRLYGSVTTADIAAAIQDNFGVEVDRRRIVPADPIKEAGEVTVKIRLQAEVEATLTVKVVAETTGESAEATEKVVEEPAETVEEPAESPEDTKSE